MRVYFDNGTFDPKAITILIGLAGRGGVFVVEQYLVSL